MRSLREPLTSVWLHRFSVTELKHKGYLWNLWTLKTMMLFFFKRLVQYIWHLDIYISNVYWLQGSSFLLISVISCRPSASCATSTRATEASSTSWRLKSTTGITCTARTGAPTARLPRSSPSDASGSEKGQMGRGHSDGSGHHLDAVLQGTAAKTGTTHDVAAATSLLLIFLSTFILFHWNKVQTDSLRSSSCACRWVHLDVNILCISQWKTWTPDADVHVHLLQFIRPRFHQRCRWATIYTYLN